MAAVDQWLATHPRLLKVITLGFIASVIVVSYLVLLVLFLKPEALLIDSLLYPAGNTTTSPRLTPPILVAIFSALLTGSTVAIVTRCVEENLWYALTPRNSRAGITVAESRWLAQWSISAAARLQYLVLGGSWLLRFSGLCILFFAAVSPVLLKGIAQVERTVSASTYQPRSDPFAYWTGFVDDSNAARWGGTLRDLPGEAAFLASMSGLSAPPIDVCDAGETCRVNARMAGFQTICKSEKFDNPNKVGIKDSDKLYREQFCSSLNSRACVDLVRGDSATSVNFTSAAPGDSTAGGEFAVIYGAFTSRYRDTLSDYSIYTVDCEVRYGFVNVTQDGIHPPTIQRDTFRVAPTSQLNTTRMGFLPYLYQNTDAVVYSPFAFVGGAASAGTEIIFKYPIGAALIGPNAMRTGSDVAQRVEAAWDMDNLFAFSRWANTTDRLITRETPRMVYVYDAKVLLVLVLPLLATILGVWKRWQVLGPELMLGYDPVKIARCGPVFGVATFLDEESIDRLRVGRYAQVGLDAESGHHILYYQFIASDDRNSSMGSGGLGTESKVGSSGAE
jgi:hypothetical protein